MNQISNINWPCLYGRDTIVLLHYIKSLKQRFIMKQVGLDRPVKFTPNWYPINIKWLALWKESTHFDTHDEIKASDILCGLHPGPIDNCNLGIVDTKYMHIF
eukprot:83738_1